MNNPQDTYFKTVRYDISNWDANLSRPVLEAIGDAIEIRCAKEFAELVAQNQLKREEEEKERIERHLQKNTSVVLSIKGNNSKDV